ncbi:hypothetical protein [Brevibacillus sp. H7]|uniref:hypothetical protein n=1 Tax=Brevibacillus sp. H7 TaxID=3349138 RepID=UPI0038288F3F
MANPAEVDIRIQGDNVGEFLSIVFGDSQYRNIGEEAVITYDMSNFIEASKLLKANGNGLFKISANGKMVQEMADIKRELAKSVLRKYSSEGDRGFDLKQIHVDRWSEQEIDAFLSNPDRGIEDAVNAVNAVEGYGGMDKEAQDRLHEEDGV